MIFHNTKLINLWETEVSLFYLYCWLFFSLAERCRQPLATLRERLHLSARATLLLHFVLELAAERFPFRYFSIISAAMGAATSEPQPPCSIYTEIATLGFVIGAKPIKTEWSLPAFSAVPVFPQIVNRGVLIADAVPFVTHFLIPLITTL